MANIPGQPDSEIKYKTAKGYADFHALRHAFATALDKGGANGRQAQSLMRHASRAQTERYTHLDMDDQIAGLAALGNSHVPPGNEQAQPSGADEPSVSMASAGPNHADSTRPKPTDPDDWGCAEEGSGADAKPGSQTIFDDFRAEVIWRPRGDSNP